MYSFNFTQDEREGEREKPTFVAVIYWVLLAAVLLGTAVVPLSEADLVFLLVPPS